MNKYEKLATEILEAVGSKENVTYVTHCMTRLRFTVKDQSIIDLKDVEKINGVLGCQVTGGQFQVIVGQGVDKVYQALCEIGNFEAQERLDVNIDVGVKEKMSLKKIGNGILDAISGCLTPIIPVLIVAGLIKMIVAVIGPTMLNLVSETSDLYRLFTWVGDAGFYAFPIFVAYSGSRKFGSNVVISLLFGFLLISPTYNEIVSVGEPFTVYGIPMILSSYSSTVIPMILITWVMSYVEKGLKRVVPEVLSSTFIPLFTVLIMLPLGLCLLAPLGSILGIYLGQALMWIRSIFGPFGVAIIGALYGIIVAAGMHLPIITTAVISIMTVGYDDTILVGGMLAVYSSIAICLAVMVKGKTASEKGLGLSCLLAQALGGVGEPALFGIIIRNKKAMLFSTIGVFVGALYAAFMNVAVYILASSNILAVLAYGGGSSNNMLHGTIGAVITFVITFVLVMIFGYEDKEKAEDK